MARRLPRGTIPSSRFGFRHLARGDSEGSFNKALRSIERRAARGSTITLYRAINTENQRINKKRRASIRAPARERGGRSGSSWTPSIGAARMIADMRTRPGTQGMIYSIKVPASEIRAAIREQKPEHGRHILGTVLKGGIKSKWAIGGDLPGYVEVQPQRLVKQKPRIVQTFEWNDDEKGATFSRVNQAGWFREPGAVGGSAKGKLSGKGGGGGGGG